MAVIHPKKPIETPFVVPPNRAEITDEPEPRGTGADPRFPDVSWIGSAQQGGGPVPGPLRGDLPGRQRHARALPFPSFRP